MKRVLAFAVALRDRICDAWGWFWRKE